MLTARKYGNLPSKRVILSIGSLPCRSILDLGRPRSEADHRSQLPKLTAVYPNSLSSLWIRLRRDPLEARPLTERDRWTGSDLDGQSLVWQCCSPDADRRSAMPMWDRTPAAASTPAQTLMWDRSTRRRSTKARSWQNGHDDRSGNQPRSLAFGLRSLHFLCGCRLFAEGDSALRLL